MIYVGLDNGNDGGVAAIEVKRGKRRLLLAQPVPTVNLHPAKKKRILNVVECARIVRTLQDLAGEDIVAVLEYAQAYPLEGAVNSFAYGRCFGAWEGILSARQIRYVIADPKEWQPVILKGVEGADTKARSVLKTQRLFPDLRLVLPRCRNPHDGMADAVCMALYAETLTW